MDNIYRTINSYGEDEIIIKKSRFIGYAKPIESEEEALEFIEEISKKHRDATHNVYAYVLGPDSNIQRFNDDGEPSGTAGIPILEVIKKEELRNVVVVVTRYFGGIKLGGGGLIRAYTKGGKIGLDGANIVDMVLHRRIGVRIDYTLYGRLENYLLSEGYIIENSIFDDGVNLELYIRFDEIETFENAMVEISSGTCEIKRLDEKHIPLKDGNRLI